MGLKQLESQEQGFTLIEILVVILVIGILAAIAIPVFLNQRQVALTASIESNARNINNALTMYGLREGQMPHMGPLAADGMQKDGNPEKLLGLSLAEAKHPKSTATVSSFPESQYGPWMVDNVYGYRAFESTSNTACWNVNQTCDSYLLTYKTADGKFKTVMGTLKPDKCKQDDVSVTCTA